MPTKSEKPSARKILAQNLLRLRKQREWSQEKLADEAGFHRTFVGHLEREMRNPSLENVERLADVLDVTIGELLTLPT